MYLLKSKTSLSVKYENENVLIENENVDENENVQITMLKGSFYYTSFCSSRFISFEM